MKNAIIALLIIFSVFNLVLIRGYEEANDKLVKANEDLIQVGMYMMAKCDCSIKDKTKWFIY